MTARALIPDSYWVEPGLLAAGEYPGTRFRATTREKLGVLLDAGIRSFIDLTEQDELRPYLSDLEDIGAARGIRVGHFRVPIRDLEVPSGPQLRDILDLIERCASNESAGRPHPGPAVYVHCRAGVGRTGTVIGCWLARNGFPGQTALGRLAELRTGLPDGYRPSPETAEQRQFVLAFTAGR